MAMRRRLVVGNWKMHGSQPFVDQLLEALKPQAAMLRRTEMVVCPPFVYLAQAIRLLAGSGIGIGAQNVSEHSEGAFTGEIAASMLKEIGCRYVIVGHSERRTLFGESSEQVARKVVAALAAGVTPIICVGETLAEREAGRTLAVVAAQMDAVLEQIDSQHCGALVWAYEPVWAIGTGRTATPEQAQQVHAFLRQRLTQHGAAAVPLLYGGSVKADNAAQLFAQRDIDGGLVGGASMDAETFGAICRAAE
jgi:triosephosphate isomerase